MSDTSTLVFHSDARSQMIEGVMQLSNAVSVTLGPKGKNVAIIKRGERPHLTKDGVTVANSINLKDAFQNLGCQIVKEAAQRSADVVGDGTTTATVLAASLLQDGHRLLETGNDARQVVMGMEAACHDVLEALEETRVDLDDHEQLISVATISANGEEVVGKIVAEAIEKVGPDGPITVENARGFDTQLEIVEGTIVDRGYLSPYFATDQSRSNAELKKVCIFIYNQVISNAQTILPVLEYAASANRSLLIVSNDVTNEALQTLVLNKMKGALSVCAIKAPEFGNARIQALQDLAVVCGGSVVALEESGSLDDLESILGYAEKVIVDKHGTLLIETGGDKVEINDRVKKISEELDQVGLSDSDRGVLNRRMRRMSEGVAIIRVGGRTEVEMYERHDRVNDALCASRSAKKSGLQPGGGCALVHAAKKCSKRKKSFSNEAFSSSYDMFLKVCQSPLRQIVANAGEIPEIVLRKLLRGNATSMGYDVLNDDYGNMFELKIIDPHDVVSSSLKHAVSVACNILLIGCAISIENDEEEGGLGLIENL
tara:strand:+ start:130 stop:1758 length:1629 start_codon:yes stop_codon:yes gene_type:complete